MTRGRVIADGFLPYTLGLSALTWPVMGSQPALAVLWTNTGGTMGLLGPVSALVDPQLMARQGILVKDGRALESLRHVDTIVFDKTGTLTLDEPTVVAVHETGAWPAHQVLRLAAAAEFRQSHPIARALLAKAEEWELSIPLPDEASYHVGYGIRVEVEGRLVRVGSARFMEHEAIAVPADVESIRGCAESESHSLLYVAFDDHLAGIVEMQPTVRPEAAGVVQYLRSRGIKVVIISGDHERPTRRLAEALGIDTFFADTSPERKGAMVDQLRAEGAFVGFVGDGINDAIALKSAQVSISLRGAATAATDTAQVVFMDGTLGLTEPLFRFMDEFEATMDGNFLTSVVPGLAGLGGIFLLDLSVGAAMGLSVRGVRRGTGELGAPAGQAPGVARADGVISTPTICVHGRTAQPFSWLRARYRRRVSRHSPSSGAIGREGCVRPR